MRPSCRRGSTGSYSCIHAFGWSQCKFAECYFLVASMKSRFTSNKLDEAQREQQIGLSACCLGWQACWDHFLVLKVLLSAVAERLQEGSEYSIDVNINCNNLRTWWGSAFCLPFIRGRQMHPRRTCYYSVSSYSRRITVSAQRGPEKYGTSLKSSERGLRFPSSTVLSQVPSQVWGKAHGLSWRLLCPTAVLRWSPWGKIFATDCPEWRKKV